MKSRIASGMGAALLTVALASAAVASDGRAPPENRYGLPVSDAAAQRLLYQQKDLAATALSARVSADLTAQAEPRPADASVVPEEAALVHRNWSYALFGAGIGESGIVVADMGAGTEVVVAGTAKSQFGPNDHWVALQYSAASGQYEQTGSSRLAHSAIVSLAAADLDGNGFDELLVLHTNGVMERFGGAGKRHLSDLNTGVSSPTRMRVSDVDGDGSLELLIVNSASLYVFGADGTLRAEVAGAGGDDVVAANMDDDPGMEIVTTGGTVFDVASGTVQWNRPEGFGRRLLTLDTDGDGRAELIAAEAWYIVRAYDVERQLPKWSIPVELDVAAIQAGDVNSDGLPELLIADGQWGQIKVYDLAGTLLNAIDNPEHGVTDMAVADVDGNGQAELLWGAGATSTGEDHLYVASAETGAIAWQSIDLVGPFIGPIAAGLDGKGVLVVASSFSDAGYSSGRLLVFSESGRLLGISEPLFGTDNSLTGIHDLDIRDMDGDNRNEILVASDWLYDGAIEAYGYHRGSFTLEWSNVTRPEGAPFYSVDARDVDGDGAMEIVAGGGRIHTGAEGVFLHVFDRASGVEEWHSMQCGGYWDKIISLEILDPDADGNQEMAALLDSGDLLFFEGKTRQLEAVMDGGYSAIFTRINGTLQFGTGKGRVGTVRVTDGLYGRGGVGTYGSRAVRGILSLEPGRMVIGAGNRLNYWIDGALAWESPAGGTGYGRYIDRTRKGFATAGLVSLDSYVRQ